MENRLRKLFKSGKVGMGMLVGIPTSEIIDMAGFAGFDYVWLDTEHCNYDFEVLQQMLRCAEAHQMATIVRVYGPDQHLISKVLDMAPDGVLLSQTNNKADAEALVKCCKLAPLGERGAEPSTRAAHFAAVSMDEYTKLANDVVVGVMIETKEGVENCSEIFGVPGIELCTVGPSDLSWSLGVPRDSDATWEAAHKVYEAAVAANVINIRAIGNNADMVKRWLPLEPKTRIFRWGADRMRITKFFVEDLKRCHKLVDECIGRK